MSINIKETVGTFLMAIVVGGGIFFENIFGIGWREEDEKRKKCKNNVIKNSRRKMY